MRILLSNDDGINGHGMKVLEKIARTLSDDVWIVAPELDQSGSSHSLTLRDPLRIREISPRKYAVSGTPTDCVMLAVSHLMKDKRPDLVLSGINYGANVAEDVTYSGTIAAAIEGALLNIRSIAFSVNIQYGSPAKWATAEHFGPEILKTVSAIPLEKNVIINVNFPDVVVSSVKGIRITTQGHRSGEDELVECKDPRGKSYFWMGAGMYRYTPDASALESGSDLEAIHDGYISITPLTLNLTHEKTLSCLKGAFGL
ncbi:MAG: 5'/3'-nucleotidase SurE [Alphaproteobacteria bacterium]|nr:5'/3'-nucleotidase SurE [Alphaproteobacteria bacterium]